MAAFLNFLSLLLAILTPLSYVPQYQRLLALHASCGISIWAIFLVVLVFQGQIANMFYLFQSAHDMRYGVPIATPPSLRDWINAAQIIIQWLCALGLYGIVVYLPVHPTNSTDSVASSDEDGGTVKKVTATLLAVHAASFAISIAVGGRAYGEQDPIFNTISFIIFFIVQPLLLLALLLSSMVQALTTFHDGLGSLDKRTVLLQCLLFLALAITWPFRLILPKNLWNSPQEQPAWLNAWYPWVGWACINSAVISVGSAILLCIGSKLDIQLRNAAERRALLAN